jgi:probable HAF family extracellular repeat protein
MKKLLGVLAVILVSCLAAQAEVVYYVESVNPSWVSDYQSFGYCVNENGQVAGEYDVDFSGSSQSHVYYWQNGAAFDLSWHGFPLDMNDSGQIAGFTSDLPLNNPYAAAWVDGAVQDIHSQGPGWQWSQANGNNNAGVVVGEGSFAEYGPGYPNEAFTWTKAGGLVNYNDLAGWEESSFYDINNKGQIAGFVMTNDKPGLPEGNYRFIWTDANADNQMELSEIARLTFYPKKINENGEAVGSKTWREPYVYANGEETALPVEDPSLIRYSFARAINDNGDVVGTTRFNTGHTNGWLWDGTTLTYLNDLTLSDPSWSIGTGSDINNRGQIAAYGTHPGDGGAILLTPYTVLTPEISGATADVTYDPFGAAGGFGAGLAPGNDLVGGTAAVENLSFSGAFWTMMLQYDPADLATLGIAEPTLRLYWHDDALGQWLLAGNPSNLTYNPLAEFVTGAPTAVLGDWGIDLAANYVWANVDHASTFGVVGSATVPVPGSMLLGLLGVGGLAVMRRFNR